MEGGYSGRLMLVDLARGKASVEPYPVEVAVDFLGGFGANNRLFPECSRPGIDPLSPQNPVVFGAGPLVGTMVPGSSRIMANARLPLTGAVASAGGSMGMGANLKWCGLDHLVLMGGSPQPSYLYIEDDRVEFVPAPSLWGKGILETTRSLWASHPGSSVLAIGPAGRERGLLLPGHHRCLRHPGKGRPGRGAGKQEPQGPGDKGQRRGEDSRPCPIAGTGQGALRTPGALSTCVRRRRRWG